MWSNNTLHLPQVLWETYTAVLQNNGVLDECTRGTENKNIHGGANAAESLEHFIHRFPNSASRLCYIVKDPAGDLSEASRSVITSFPSHEIFVLDLVGGTGAGTIGILAAICHQRIEGELPKLPLTVNIYAADISDAALQIYSEMIDNIRAPCLAIGIKLNYCMQVWDATDVAQTSQLCDNWLAQAGAAEVFVLVSNISGAGNSLLEEFKRSFQHVTERVANRAFTLLWIEPRGRGSKNFLTRVVNGIFSAARWVTHYFTTTTDHSYKWKHELLIGEKILPGGLQLLNYDRSPS